MITFPDITSSLSLTEAYTLLIPLLGFMIIMGLYSVFIFKFYKFIARKEIFKSDPRKKDTESSTLGKIFHSIIYTIKYIMFLPLLTFFWILILAIILSFLSKNNQPQTILLISIALVGVIRTISYFSEDLAKDLAKMLPFALLGIFLVDISYFSLPSSLESIYNLIFLWKTMIYYLIFIVIMEWVLRIGNTTFSKK